MSTAKRPPGPDEPVDDIPEPGAERGPSAADWAVRVVFPGIVALLFVALLALETTDPSYDLHLLAPMEAPAGSPVALRAIAYRGMDRPEGAEVVDAPVRVTLVDASNRTRRSVDLVRSPLGGSEGRLTLPDDARGVVRLVARTNERHGSMVLERQLVVTASSAVATRPRRGAPVFAVHGPLEPVGNAAPPSRLELRVGGGACVPELPCDLFVWVGAPAASVRLDPGPTVEARGDTASSLSGGVVRFDVTVHGPEPSVTLVSLRDATEVARRTVTLPLSSGGVRVELARSVVRSPSAPRLRATTFGGNAPLAVDVFDGRTWVASFGATARTLAQGVDLPVDLRPGIYRLQVRRDVASVDGAGQALVALLPPDSGDALGRLARAVAAVVDDPRTAAATHEVLPAGPEDDVARFLASPAEAYVVPLPPPTSAALQAATGAVERKSGRRRAVALGILLSGLAVASIVVRKGLGAADQARRILAEAEVDDALSGARRRRMTASVIGAGLLVLLAFALAAALVLSRGVV